MKIGAWDFFGFWVLDFGISLELGAWCLEVVYMSDSHTALAERLIERTARVVPHDEHLVEVGVRPPDGDDLPVGLDRDTLAQIGIRAEVGDDDPVLPEGGVQVAGCRLGGEARREACDDRDRNE